MDEEKNLMKSKRKDKVNKLIRIWKNKIKRFGAKEREEMWRDSFRD